MVKSDMQPASDAFEITREGDAFTVLQDGEPIYTDREMQTLCIMDDAAAYGTKDNKVYQIDISTGKHTAICYVEGWESSDWGAAASLLRQPAAIPHRQPPLQTLSSPCWRMMTAICPSDLFPNVLLQDRRNIHG